MGRLHQALTAAQRDSLKGGGVLSDSARRRLGSLERSLAVQGWVIFLLVVVGAGLAIWGAVLNIHDATGLTAFAGALGLSVATALELLRRTWRELGRTSLLLILIEHSDEAQLAALVDKLIKDLPR